MIGKNYIWVLLVSLSLSACGDPSLDVMTDPLNATSKSAPKAAISAPSKTTIATGKVTYKVKYTGVSKVSLRASQVSVKKTGTVTYTKSVSGGTTTAPIITLTITGGTGKIDSISIPSGTGINSANRKTAAVSQTRDVVVDNTPPYVPVPPTISLGTLNTIHRANETSYSIGGTCSNDGDTISITSPIGISGSTACASGTFNISSLDVSGLSDGSIDFTVRIENVDGTDEDTASITKDALAPTLAITSMPMITNANKNSYSFSGTCSEAGRVVNLTTPQISSTSCTLGSFSFSGLNVSGLSDGNTTFSVNISDEATNQTIASRIASKDTTPPTNPSCSAFDGKATPTKSDPLTWSGSTDATSGMNHYEMSVGTSSPGEHIGWTNIGSNVQPYQFTGISPKLYFDQEYYTYIRAVDNVGLVSSVVACGPWKVSPGYGNFRGTNVDSKVDSDHLNQVDPYHLVYATSEFNDAYLSFRDESKEVAIVESGNYLLSLNMPMIRKNGNDTSNVASASATVLINGSVVKTAFAANSFTRGKSDQENPIRASNSMTVLLDNLHEGDVVTVQSINNADENEPLVVERDSAFSTYLEYIPEEAAVLSATSEKTTSGENFNERDPAQLLWSKIISHDEYNFDDGSSEIKLNKGGNFIVSLNVPVMGDAENQKIEARILVNGRETNNDIHTVAANGLISGLNNHFKSSTNFTNVLYNLEPGDVITVQTRELGNRGNVFLPPKTAASLYMQRINVDEKFFISTGESPRDWNTDNLIAWMDDFASDRSFYTHNSRESEIFIEQDGNYMAYVSSYMVSDTNLIKPITRIKINGVAYASAECSNNTMIKEYSDTRFANCDMQVMLQGLKKGDSITYATDKDILDGTVEGFNPRITLKRVSDTTSRRR